MTQSKSIKRIIKEVKPTKKEGVVSLTFEDDDKIYYAKPDEPVQAGDTIAASFEVVDKMNKITTLSVLDKKKEETAPKKDTSDSIYLSEALEVKILGHVCSLYAIGSDEDAKRARVTDTYNHLRQLIINNLK